MSDTRAAARLADRILDFAFDSDPKMRAKADEAATIIVALQERDISSDPVDYKRDGSCAQCGAVGHRAADCPNVPRAAQALRDAIKNDDSNVYIYTDDMIHAVQIEATDEWAKAFAEYVAAINTLDVSRQMAAWDRLLALAEARHE